MQKQQQEQQQQKQEKAHERARREAEAEGAGWRRRWSTTLPGQYFVSPDGRVRQWEAPDAAQVQEQTKMADLEAQQEKLEIRKKELDKQEAQSGLNAEARAYLEEERKRVESEQSNAELEVQQDELEGQIAEANKTGTDTSDLERKQVENELIISMIKPNLQAIGNIRFFPYDFNQSENHIADRLGLKDQPDMTIRRIRRFKKFNFDI